MKPVGYLTELKGLSANLTSMTVHIPPIHEPVGYNGVAITHPPGTPGQINPLGQINVIGVLEKFEWDGGVGHPVTFEALMSQENAEQLKATQQSALTTVDAIGWWIIDYDQETKTWYEAFYPSGPVSGLVGPKDNPELNVDLNPVPAALGSDLNVYRVELAVIPAVNTQFTFHVATSPTTRTVASWGLKVGGPPVTPVFNVPPN